MDILTLNPERARAVVPSSSVSLADVLRPVADVDRWLTKLCEQGFSMVSVRSGSPAAVWKDYLELCTHLGAYVLWTGVP